MAGASHDAERFGAEYYATACGRPYARNQEWLDFFGAIAGRIASDIGPRRVLDAGCALGLLVETLRARGIDARGIDISTYAIASAAPEVAPFLRQGSVADEFDDRYDLIISIEVLEHMEPAQAEAAIANICRHTDDVLFSSSPLDYRETTHVNVRPPEYWGEQFARHGFVRDVDFDASFITPWAVRFRRTAEPLHRIVAGYERVLAPLTRERAELRTGLIAMEEELRRTQKEVTAARAAAAAHADTIGHMERSLFWKLRGLTMRLRERLGRGPAGRG